MPKLLLARMLERGLTILVWLCALIILAATLGMGLYLLMTAFPVLLNVDARVWQYRWDISNQSFGLYPMIYGTLWTSLASVALGFPIALCSALFITQWPSRVTRVMERVIRLGGAIPPILIGLVVASAVVPVLGRVTDNRVTFSGVAAVAVLLLMITPAMTSLLIRHLRRVPRRMIEGSSGLGASKCQTIRRIVLPAAARGFASVPLLMLMRAIGESAALMLVIGNVPAFYTSGPAMLQNGIRTLATHILTEMNGMVMGGSYFNALFAAAFLLALSTLIMHWAVKRIERKAAEA